MVGGGVGVRRFCEENASEKLGILESPHGHLLVDLQNRKNLCWVILFFVWCLKKIKLMVVVGKFNSFFLIFNLPYLRSISFANAWWKDAKEVKRMFCIISRKPWWHIYHIPQRHEVLVSTTKLNEEIGRKYLISIKHIDHPSCFTFDSLVTNDFWRDPSLWDWFHKNTIWNLIAIHLWIVGYQ